MIKIKQNSSGTDMDPFFSFFFGWGQEGISKFNMKIKDA